MQRITISNPRTGFRPWTAARERCFQGWKSELRKSFPTMPVQYFIESPDRNRAVSSALRNSSFRLPQCHAHVEPPIRSERISIAYLTIILERSRNFLFHRVWCGYSCVHNGNPALLFSSTEPWRLKTVRRSGSWSSNGLRDFCEDPPGDSEYSSIAPHCGRRGHGQRKIDPHWGGNTSSLYWLWTTLGLAEKKISCKDILRQGILLWTFDLLDV